MILGHDNILDYLQKVIDTDNIPNAFLFKGISGIGKKCTAKFFAKNILCKNEIQRNKFDHNNHPDYLEIFPEGKLGLYTINSIRDFITEVYMPPYESNYRVFVISDAHRLNKYSANALLKTIEEPLKSSIIILTTDRVDVLLPTIRSRVIEVAFKPLSFSNINKILKKDGLKCSEEEYKASTGDLNKARLIASSKYIMLDDLFLNMPFDTYLKIENIINDIEDMFEKHLSIIKEKVLKIDNLEQKYIEGIMSCEKEKFFKKLCNDVLNVFRDIEILKNKKSFNKSFLNSGISEDKLILISKRVPQFSIKKIFNMISDCKKEFDRNISINNIFEKFFINLFMY